MSAYDSKTVRRAAEARKAEADARALAELDRMSREMGAARAAEEVVRKAAAEQAEARRREALSPLEREIEDHCRESLARLEARNAAEAEGQRQEPTMSIDSVISANQAAREQAAKNDPAILAQRADELAVIASTAADVANGAPTAGNKASAAIAFAEAAKAGAAAAFAKARQVAEQAVVDAVARAGDDPVSRARAKADAITKHASALGHAEIAVEEADLAFDRLVVETARTAKTMAHRIESAKARAEAAAKAAANDPQAIGNPYYRARPTLSDWQWDALDPAAKAQATKDGVVIVADPAPALTKAEALSVLKSRGSSRQVLTAAEFKALDPAAKAKAAARAILIDE